MDRTDVTRLWEHLAQVITRATGLPVRTLTAEHRRDALDGLPEMVLLAVGFADNAPGGRGCIAAGIDCDDLMRVREIWEATEALAPTLRLRPNARSASRMWRVGQGPGRRAAFRDLLGPAPSDPIRYRGGHWSVA